MATLSCGIIGLPNVGKSTLFNALTRGNAEVANFPFSTISPNRGVAYVSDPRLEELAKFINPQKIIPAAVEFIDVAGLVKNAHQGEGLGNEFLSRIRGIEVLVEVVRCFQGRGVSHPEGSIDPIRDIETLELELFFSDLSMVERRLTKPNKMIKSSSRVPLFEKVKEALMKGEFPQSVCSETEIRELAKEGFLTAKPLIYVVNIEAEETANHSLKELREYLKKRKAEWIEICAQLDMELGELPPEERKEFLKELNIKENREDKLIKRTYRLLNLITFFTITGGREVRAWAIKRGSTVREAAGKVHSDMERGFIRAEVIPVSSLLKFHSPKEAKEKGKIRIEGKDYKVEDGDVIHFIFAVR